MKKLILAGYVNFESVWEVFGVFDTLDKAVDAFIDRCVPVGYELSDLTFLELTLNEAIY